MKSINPKTVQGIPDKLFEIFLKYALGDSFQSMVNGFPELTLIQPIKIDSKMLGIGLHREGYVSHFFLFDSPDAYKEKTNKNRRVLTVFGGKVHGIHGMKQYYKNRIYCDISLKIKGQQNHLFILEEIVRELNKIVRKKEVENFEQGLPLKDVPILKSFTGVEDKPF